MSVNANIPYTQIIVTNSMGQQTFDGNFTIQNPTDISVFVTPDGQPPSDVGDLIAYGTAYSVVINGQTGFTVTTVAVIPINSVVTLVGTAKIARPSDFNNSVPYTPQNINTQFDATVINEKQVLMDALRSPHYMFTEEMVANVDNLLPILGPNQTWGKNSMNNEIVAVNLPGDDPGAAALRADLLSSGGAGIVGALQYSTVQSALNIFQQAGPHYAVDTSITVNEIEISITPAPASPIIFLLVKLENTNNSSAVTIAINGGAPIDVVQANGSSLLADSLIGGTIYELAYDPIAPAYRVLNIQTGNESAWPPMFINGGYTTNNALDPGYSIDFQTVFCRDFGNNINGELNSVITKSVNNPWIQGDNQGGFPSTETLNPGDTVHRFVIFKANGTADAGFDKNLNASSLLADAAGDGYIYYRRVASQTIAADGTWRPGLTDGDYTYYTDDYNLYLLTVANSSTPQPVDLPIPTINCTALCYVDCGFISSTGATGERLGALFPIGGATPTGTADNLSGRSTTVFSWDSINNRNPVPAVNGQCNYVTLGTNPNSDNATINAVGWIDKRYLF